jgi:hypothetical protein
VDESISHLARAYQLLPPEQLKERLGNYTRFRLGVAYMRLGETLNCCQRHTPESCIVPIQGAGIHQRREGSAQAIRFFEEILRDVDPEDDLYVEAQWLYNIAHMTLGGYPDRVPEPFRVPEDVFRTPIEFPRFTNVGPALGLDNFNLAGGAVVDDFDNDELLDVVTSTWDPSGTMHFFRNRGDGSFEDRTVASGLAEFRGGLNMVQADYDNDGDVDIFVLRGAWARDAGRHPNSLLRNNGDGTFTDQTFAAGLGEEHYPTQTAAWGDYDNDGDLDLYVGNESSDLLKFDPYTGEEDGAGALRAPSQLFRNNGDGTFTDVAAAAGVENLGYAKGVAWGDYDDDGDLDLYVSNLIGPNRLYRNAGDGTFYDMAGPLEVTTPTIGFPAWFWDFDNDGILDLFVASYTGRLAAVASWHVRGTARYEAPALYKGDGRGGFVNVTEQMGLDRPVLPMGSNFGDLNDDGWLDFYLGTGDPNIECLLPNLMFVNQSGRGFVNVTMAGGFGHLQKGHGVAFADFDVDGDTDVYQQMGGAFYGDEYKDALYRNPGFGHRWLGVKLIGVQTNRSAIGARVRVRVNENGVRRNIYRTVSSGGSFGCSPLRQHIGLGDANAIEELEIIWPASRRVQRFENVEADRWIEIREGSSSVRVLDLQPFTLAPSTPR